MIEFCVNYENFVRFRVIGIAFDTECISVVAH